MADLLEQVIGSTMYGSHHEKIGKVRQVYVDSRTGAPQWACVSTGWFSSDSIVPLAGASIDGDELTVQVSRDSVKSAPSLHDEGQITAAQQNDLARHYGLRPGAPEQSETGQTRNGQSGNEYREQPGSGNRDHGLAGETDGTTPTAGLGAGLGQHAKDRRSTDADVTDPRVTGTRHQADADTRTTASEPLVRSEERLNVTTEPEVVGKAQLHKTVVEETQHIEVPVRHEEVRVVREPISGGGDRVPGKPGAKLGDETREVTLHADKVHVEKTTVPVEKVRLEVDQVTETRELDETVRKERIETNDRGLTDQGSQRKHPRPE